jgi:hypothetical protein
MKMGLLLSDLLMSCWHRKNPSWMPLSTPPGIQTGESMYVFNENRFSVLLALAPHSQTVAVALGRTAENSE